MGANAQTTVQKFLSGAVLTAEQQNFSAATGVPVFATTVTRDAAFGGANKVLAEGQTCYLEDANVVQYYDGAAWATVGPAAAGGLVVLQAETAFGPVSNITRDNIFTSAYTNYKVLITFTPTVSGDTVLYRNRVGGVAAATNYQYQYSGGSGGSAENGLAVSQTSAQISSDGGSGRASLVVEIFSPQLVVGTNIWCANFPLLTRIRTYNAGHTTAAAYDGFSFTMGSGNFTGIYTIYGYAKAV